MDTQAELDKVIEDKKLEYAMDMGRYCEFCHTWVNVCDCTDCVECEDSR